VPRRGETNSVLDRWAELSKRQYVALQSDQSSPEWLAELRSFERPASEDAEWVAALDVVSQTRRRDGMPSLRMARARPRVSGISVWRERMDMPLASSTAPAHECRSARMSIGHT
jgi:hypothetical protein